MTLAEYNSYQAKRAAVFDRDGWSNGPAVERESDLHSQIVDECRKRGWIAFHGSMAQRTYRTEGEPDFIILAPGRVLFVECKSKKGKLSPEQQAMAAWAQRLGHTVHVVRRFEEFLAIVNGGQK